jgi:quercetin dioxygenase-like cupin family protein
MPGLRAPTSYFAARVIAAAVSLLLVGAAPTPAPPHPGPAPAARAPAQPPAIGRTDLQRHDLSIAGHEAIQARVDFGPGALAPRHMHPGEEIVYVLRGTLEYEVQGRASVTLNAGDVLFIPAGAVHAVRNVGSGPASELATYIVEKGRPLITLVR